MKIHIPEPCHEDWGQMSKAEKGRFCDSCAKVVVDFTKMTDDQVKHYFTANAAKKTCGRFKKDQVADTNNIYLPWNKIQNLKRYQDKFLIALLIGFGSTLFSCNGDQTMGDVCIVKDSVEVGIDTITPKIESVDTSKVESTIPQKPKLEEYYEIGDVVELTGESIIEEPVSLPEKIEEPCKPKIDTSKTEELILIGDTIIPPINVYKVDPNKVEFILGKSIRPQPDSLKRNPKLNK